MIISVNKAYFSQLPAYISPLIISSTYYALVGRAPEAYGSRPVCVCVCVCVVPVSLQWLKDKR